MSKRGGHLQPIAVQLTARLVVHPRACCVWCRRDMPVRRNRLRWHLCTHGAYCQLCPHCENASLFGERDDFT
jgi:hypothetical protein